MTMKNTKVDVTCEVCKTTALVELGQLETGKFTCAECDATFAFDNAKATALRDEMETKLERLSGVLSKLKKR